MPLQASRTAAMTRTTSDRSAARVRTGGTVTPLHACVGVEQLDLARVADKLDDERPIRQSPQRTPLGELGDSRNLNIGQTEQSGRPGKLIRLLPKHHAS